MTAVVERPDLTKRKALSKSELVTFDLCQQKAFYAIHDPRPFVPLEKVTFGSAIDAGVEVIVKGVRSGQEPDMARALDAVTYIGERDEIELDLDEANHALRRFIADVVPLFDWSHVITQASITVTLDELDECNGHPDLIFPDDSADEVWDVKATTGKSQKDPRSLELGFYVLMREAETGRPVRRVGYMEWRRKEPRGSLKEGKWVTPSFDVTDEFRRWAYERSSAYMRAKRVDAMLAREAAKRGQEPANFTFPGGPAFSSLCNDCAYNPANGGPCALAYREEVA